MKTEIVQMTVSNAELVFRLIFSCFLGCLVGYEREVKVSVLSAGIRTYGAISLGSCAFTLASLYILGAEPSRVASQVVTGIGFIGAGIIFRQGNYISGLTTAATLWAVAAVGMEIAFAKYLLGIVTTTLLLILLFLPRLPVWNKVSSKKRVKKEVPD